MQNETLTLGEKQKIRIQTLSPNPESDNPIPKTLKHKNTLSPNF